MKKLLIFTMMLALGLTIGLKAVSAEVAETKKEATENEVVEENSVQMIKDAITKYKNKNYIGCISDLRMYVSSEPSNAVAWYYLGNSYMNIALKPEAHQAFDKVVQINTVPLLTSYSIQAKICMENPEKCDYQEFNIDQIRQLKADPTTFLDNFFASRSEDNRSENEIEIENLINGHYSNNIHPDAKDFIINERAKIKQSEINANRV